MYQMTLNLDTCQVKVNLYPKNGCTKEECQESFFKAIKDVEINLSLAETQDYPIWTKENNEWKLHIVNAQNSTYINKQIMDEEML